MEPMRVLMEEEPETGALPAALAELYGGGLELAENRLHANFVSSLDGVVALPGQPSGALISGRSPADRFLLGLLRALADAVVVGAGTLRAEPGHLWTPAYVMPRLRDAFAALGRGDPRLVIVSETGDLDPAERAMQRGALVLTTDAGAAALRDRLPRTCRLESLGAGPLDGQAILAAVRAEGHRRLLTEGGPRLLATFVAGGVLNELFLTLSPLLAGRRANDGRFGLLEGVHLLPEKVLWARILSIRAHGAHLFLRYRFRPG